MGLTTALEILRGGWVALGSLPTADGSAATASAGFLIVLHSSGSPPGADALFGLAVAPHGTGLYYVDDAVNTLRLLH